MKEFNYSKVKNYHMYSVLKVIAKPFFKPFYKLSFRGKENIPGKKEDVKYIVAINHTCAIDPVFVGYPREMPVLHFMAKAELFRNPFAAWFITHMHGFPVKRGQGDNSAIKYGMKLINEGHVMAICPEGRRIKDKDGVPQPGEAKKGIAIIAQETGASVLPAAIYSPGPIKVGSRIVVSYGKLITPEEMGTNKENFTSDDAAAAANLVMQRVQNLWQAEAEADCEKN
ncbi:MAG: 1-acyl-sn-glycerol-3-phosphate acyltransferase [Ruminococcaceae bacterium]|nr:1-acyl-sn-glycerol-3-phosphate acyltransferase [Oscillospiraceae bacterium]